MSEEKAQDKRDAIHMLALLRLMCEGDPPGSSVITENLTPYFLKIKKKILEDFKEDGIDITEDELWNVNIEVKIRDSLGKVEWIEYASDELKD